MLREMFFFFRQGQLENKSLGCLMPNVCTLIDAIHLLRIPSTVSNQLKTKLNSKQEKREQILPGKDIDDNNISCSAFSFFLTAPSAISLYSSIPGIFKTFWMASSGSS